jgi:cytochrome oxidase Cu insertion factor (SCO1/SenC/PrrC family)
MTYKTLGTNLKQAENKSMLPKIIVTFLILFLINAAGGSRNEIAGQPRRQQKQAPSVRRYACPMHPEVTSRRRGKCPKCGMRLRLVPKPEASDPSAASAAPVSTGDVTAMSSAKIPDARVYDQEGRPLNFYSDLVKDKTVAINFIFTTCTGVCPPMTATLRRVQQNLPASASAVQLISISVDPTTDTPARLHEFAAKFGAGPGWTFVTGDKAEIDSILRALGVAVANKNDHTPMILIGNERADYWTRVYGLSSPTTLIQVITDAESRESKRK